MNDRKYNGPALLVGIISVVIFLSALSIGYVTLLSLVWMFGWGLFMVPIFGLPALSFQEAFGAIWLLWVIAFLTRFRMKNPASK